MKPTPQALLQVLGQNAAAQQVLQDTLTAELPELEQKYNISAQVIDKFFDWLFPFVYTEDGGGARRWRTAIKSWCGRNAKLKALEEFFESSGTAGTFEEKYGGTDTTEFTDNRENTDHEEFIDGRESEEVNKFVDNRRELEQTGFSALGETTTSALADKVQRGYDDGKNDTNTTITRGFADGKNKTDRTTTRGFTDGKNSTRQQYTRGTTRTYSDGRTWTQILKDVEAAASPVYEFINGFAYLLIDPANADCCDLYCLPSVAAYIKAVEPADTPDVKVENEGTPLNANFAFTIYGAQGPKGEDGDVVNVVEMNVEEVTQ